MLSRRNIAIFFGVVFVAMSVIVAIAIGVGHPDVPSDDIAVVDDDSINVPGLIDEGHITKDGFDQILTETAKAQGLPAAPQPSDPQYKAIKDQAVSTALDIAWITGEAQKQGVEVTDTEVDQQLAQSKQQNFKTEEEYQKYLTDQGLTEDDVKQRVRLQVISTKIENKLTESAPSTSESDAQEYYDANKSQFVQPEQRTIRIIQNADAAKVDQAYQALQADPSAANWNTVAAQYSTDPTSKDKGGVRADVIPGSFEQPLDDAIFNAPQGQLQAPIKTSTASYVFQVDSIKPEQTQSFDQLKGQIQQQLDSTKQQEVFTAFLNDYRDYWSNLTVCGDDYLIARCGNFEGNPNPCPDPSLPPEQQQQQIQAQGGCPPPVVTPSPVAPGSVQPFVPASAGAPQRPHPAGEDQTQPSVPGGLPGGIVPTG
jgi:parvulin-like peptidyl-prolyl isomerase